MALARATKGIFLVAGKRTPFGTYGGKLTPFSATDLMEVVGRAVLEQGKIQAEWIDQVIVGNVIQSSADIPYCARHTALRLGCKQATPAYMVNRLCGSGFQSVINASQDLELGLSSIVLTGGVENMSACPHTLKGLRFGIKLGQDGVLEDVLWLALQDKYIKTPMGVTAENLAEKYDISRAQCDEYALLSNQRWKQALDAGMFDDEIAPVKVKGKKGEELMTIDEHPRPNNSIENLAKLPPVFKKNGRVTAGNASGVCDGASAVILATEEACTKYNLTPLARLVGYGVSGCDPSIMGIGPVPAIQRMLTVTKLKIEDIDLIEVNEAFASQYLAVEKELSLDRNKTNAHGGAIALGHPVGTSGNRITAHLVHAMRKKGLKYSIGSACIGGGQGVALLLENCS